LWLIYRKPTHLCMCTHIRDSNLDKIGETPNTYLKNKRYLERIRFVV